MSPKSPTGPPALRAQGLPWEKNGSRWETSASLMPEGETGSRFRLALARRPVRRRRPGSPAAEGTMRFLDAVPGVVGGSLPRLRCRRGETGSRFRLALARRPVRRRRPGSPAAEGTMHFLDAVPGIVGGSLPRLRCRRGEIGSRFRLALARRPVRRRRPGSLAAEGTMHFLDAVPGVVRGSLGSVFDAGGGKPDHGSGSPWLDDQFVVAGPGRRPRRARCTSSTPCPESSVGALGASSMPEGGNRITVPARPGSTTSSSSPARVAGRGGHDALPRRRARSRRWEPSASSMPEGETGSRLRHGLARRPGRRRRQRIDRQRIARCTSSTPCPESKK